MSAPEDFAALILTHGRPGRVLTSRVLRQYGYTGPIFLVVDDEDPTLGEYRATFGADHVLVFSKAEIAERFDEADNFADRRSVFYARNACWDLARQIGVRYFIQLDDDYNSAYFRFNSRREYGAWQLRPLDDVFAALLEYFQAIPALTICMAQGGDHIGGAAGAFAKAVTLRRKAMNTFICDTERPFPFVGRINEDVNTYVSEGRRGGLFLTATALQINQAQTQMNDGGMTALYMDAGTYVKSFYSVMLAPSCVKVHEIGTAHKRIHHAIDWPTAVPVILREDQRKQPRRDAGAAGRNASGHARPKRGRSTP